MSDVDTMLDDRDERTLSFVPESERHGTVFGQIRFWFLANFQFYTVSIGFIGPAMGLSFWWTALAGFAGMVIGTMFMVLHGSQGPHLGLPQMLQSRAQFGHRGVILPIIAAIVVFLANSIIAVVIIGSGIEHVFGIPAMAVGWLCVIISAALAIFGHDFLHKAFTVLLYISFPFFVILSIALIVTHPTHGGAASPALPVGGAVVAFIVQFTVSASYNITFAPYVSDYTRFMPSSTRSWKMIAAIGVGAAASGIWMIVLGARLATSFHASDALSGLFDFGNTVLPGIGTVVALTSVLALVATMGINAYSAMLSLVTIKGSFGPRSFSRKGRVWVLLLISLIVGLVGTLITGDAVTVLNNALVLNLAVLVPWTAINLTDYFLIRRGDFVITDLLAPSSRYGMWSSSGLISYAIGLLAMAPFLVMTGVYEGFLASAVGGADLSWMIGLIASSLAYSGLRALSKVKSVSLA